MTLKEFRKIYRLLEAHDIAQQENAEQGNTKSVKEIEVQYLKALEKMCGGFRGLPR